MSESGRHPLFMPLIVLGGLLEGVGLAYSQMARPEVVLDFLTLQDFGLALVMGAAVVVAGTAITLGRRYLDRAPLTGDAFDPRVKSMDSKVVTGGVLFGVGWGLSGLCPGAAYASVGIGNYPVLWGIGGMFVGSYLQALWRARGEVVDGLVSGADDTSSAD